ncbi:TIGR01777 family protein [Marinitenerispora sediminis]|uniref:TIGR01777 family protein n=1 Tax=Marinitenerispora sediminis TaxID=1931232 RepID=A0A368SZQ6_9ACTN|nr:TIGR01777 family protein [Marinitenerispora sediminis]RCV54149.1 TIGR01777 family protein [Marinitenerispora sediminis]RCV54370.1 TIGR01777 family protein [Marinitenerispora sediminis]
MAITGASGLIGTALSESLAHDGHEVLHLVRRTPRTSGEVGWDPYGGEVDTSGLAGTDAVVHLAGRPLGPARWTRARKASIRESRIQGTAALAAALGRMERPPARLLSASAVGFYGDTGERTATEDTPRGTGFLADLVVDWEAATRPAERAGVSVAHLRSAVVLARSGGLLAALLPLFRAGLGARLGDGRQYLSWISLADEVGAVRFLLERPELTGPVNLCAPEPVTNAEFTSALGRALRRPAALSAPALAVRAALGGFADEAVLVSQRVRPQRLLDAGYSFRNPEVRGALSDIIRGGSGA